jgi:hypothetical protein
MTAQVCEGTIMPNTLSLPTKGAGASDLRLFQIKIDETLARRIHDLHELVCQSEAEEIADSLTLGKFFPAPELMHSEAQPLLLFNQLMHVTRSHFYFSVQYERDGEDILVKTSMAPMETLKEKLKTIKMEETSLLEWVQGWFAKPS